MLLKEQLLCVLRGEIYLYPGRDSNPQPWPAKTMLYPIELPGHKDTKRKADVYRWMPMHTSRLSRPRFLYSIRTLSSHRQDNIIIIISQYIYQKNTIK